MEVVTIQCFINILHQFKISQHLTRQIQVQVYIATPILIGATPIQGVRTRTAIYIQPRYSSSHQVQTNLARTSSGVLLGTAVIKIHHKVKLYTARRIPAQNVSAQVSGLNNGISARCNKMCSITLSSRFDLTLRTWKLPSCSVDISNFRTLPVMQLADSDFYTKSDTDILMGRNYKKRVRARNSVSMDFVGTTCQHFIAFNYNQ